MSIQCFGWILVVLGALGAIVSLSANPLGIGSNLKEFGWLQSLGAVLGLLAVAVGLRLTLRMKPEAPKPIRKAPKPRNRPSSTKSRSRKRRRTGA